MIPLGVCVCVCVRECVHTHSSRGRPHGLEPTKLHHPWDFPGKNTGVGCHGLLQGNLPNPGIEPTSVVSPALAGEFFTTVPPGKP